jgi:hypothetical protein
VCSDFFSLSTRAAFVQPPHSKSVWPLSHNVDLDTLLTCRIKAAEWRLWIFENLYRLHSLVCGTQKIYCHNRSNYWRCLFLFFFTGLLPQHVQYFWYFWIFDPFFAKRVNDEEGQWFGCLPLYQI